jgi:sugar lactone lactonase YvrE
MKNTIRLTILLSLALAVNTCMSQTYIISTFAGTGVGGYNGDSVAATVAEINNPEAVKVDTAGNVYITDFENNRIRMVNTSGLISTIAGTGVAGNSGNGGLATAATLNHPYCAAMNLAGDLYIAEGYNNDVRYVKTTGIISTIAGNGTAGYSGDGGFAFFAELNAPDGFAFDTLGDYFIADLSNNRVRKVNKAGIISTVAGNGTAGFSGDGGPADSAELNAVADIAADAAGNIYIADFNNNRIREVNSLGIITTIAGNGTAGYSGDGGPATSAELNFPDGVAVDSSGNVYIADNDNNLIRKVSTGGIITTIAGNGTAGYTGDGGPATSAELNNPAGLAVDKSGNVYIADVGNNVIRELMPTPLGIKNMAAVTASVSVFPNPNNGIFSVQLVNGQQLVANSYIEVYNMLGQEAYTSAINSASIKIDLSNSPAGVYLYRVITMEGKLVSNGKLVIQ